MIVSDKNDEICHQNFHVQHQIDFVPTDVIAQKCNIIENLAHGILYPNLKLVKHTALPFDAWTGILKYTSGAYIIPIYFLFFIKEELYEMIYCYIYCIVNVRVIS